MCAGSLLASLGYTRFGQNDPFFYYYYFILFAWVVNLILMCKIYFIHSFSPIFLNGAKPLILELAEYTLIRRNIVPKNDPSRHGLHKTSRHFSRHPATFFHCSVVQFWCSDAYFKGWTRVSMSPLSGQPHTQQASMTLCVFWHLSITASVNFFQQFVLR